MAESNLPTGRLSPETTHSAMPLTNFPKYQMAIYTAIGGRSHQEDRFTFCSQLIPGRDDTGFFGVFDGTVGSFASDNVQRLFLPHLLNTNGWKQLAAYMQNQGPTSTSLPAGVQDLLASAIRDAYHNADNELIHMCAEARNDYSSSTSVTAVLLAGLVGIGHLGDSRLAMGIETPEGLIGNFMTRDHKPDMPDEQARIVRNGGSVEYLQNHDNKPFIRGGDFSARKEKGENPMQLQYSRAFGGKDLKCFGLSSDPDVDIVALSAQHKLMILATDGLWDIFNANDAVRVAANAYANGLDPSAALINNVLSYMAEANQHSDNITAICVFFKPGAVFRSSHRG